MQKPFLILISIVLVVGAGFFLLQQQPKEVTEPKNGGQIDENGTKNVQDLTKEELLLSLKEAAEADDYALFAKYLKAADEQGWYKEADFQKVESAAYIKADQTYFIPGDYNKTLEVSTLVYNAVPQGWRFLYLRVLALEKLGRLDLEGNDLEGAKEYALTILRMVFRTEGANLLADVYIEKIEGSLEAQNKTEAQEFLDYIWDFEVSEERREQLIELKEQIKGLFTT